MVGGFYFYGFFFHPLFGEMIQNLHFFQMGWNHQLVQYSSYVPG